MCVLHHRPTPARAACASAEAHARAYFCRLLPRENAAMLRCEAGLLPCQRARSQECRGSVCTTSPDLSSTVMMWLSASCRSLMGIPILMAAYACSRRRRSTHKSTHNTHVKVLLVLLRDQNTQPSGLSCRVGMPPAPACRPPRACAYHRPLLSPMRMKAWSPAEQGEWWREQRPRLRRSGCGRLR